MIATSLAAINASAEFVRAPVMRHLLGYLVDETVAGRGDRLKAYSVAIRAFRWEGCGGCLTPSTRQDLPYRFACPSPWAHTASSLTILRMTAQSYRLATPFAKSGDRTPHACVSRLPLWEDCLSSRPDWR
jgi:hypothetical protein